MRHIALTCFDQRTFVHLGSEAMNLVISVGCKQQPAARIASCCVALIKCANLEPGMSRTHTSVQVDTVLGVRCAMSACAKP